MIFDDSSKTSASFLAVMSHELRTPMQSVFGMLELIERNQLTDDTRQMVKAARTSAASLLEILDDVLDLAKIDADKMELEQIEMPVRTLVQGVLEALQVRTHGRAITLKDEIEDTVPKIILGDPKRLRQILMNLTGNALKFTETGSVTIKVTRQHQYNDHNVTLKFEVCDTGIGLSEDALSKIFEPFVQADNTTARKYGGTGLGLAICKKLVERMGGTLSVNSTKNVGSTFYFNLPALVVADDFLQDLPNLEGLSVLSLEDHPKGALEIVRSLKSMGAMVENVTTVENARKLIDQRPFDIAVVDQGLPDGLGLDFIRYALTRRPGMGLLMYTVRDDEGLKQELLSLGVSYLAKPSGRYKLGQTIADIRLRTRPKICAHFQRILIVEDTASIRLLIEKQMKVLGVQADSVENGEAALQAMQEKSYGLVLTDLHMPGMDGYGLIQAIRENETSADHHLPVIVMTADIALAEGQAYLKHGFDEMLIKPVSIGQIQFMLMRWGILDAPDINISPEILKTKTNEPVNLEALAAQIGGQKKDALDMLITFTEMTHDLIKNIRAFSDKKDFINLEKVAHSLKGAARSVCAPQLGDLAAQLQIISESKEAKDSLIEDIEKTYEQIKVFSKTISGV